MEHNLVLNVICTINNHTQGLIFVIKPSPSYCLMLSHCNLAKKCLFILKYSPMSFHIFTGHCSFQLESSSIEGIRHILHGSHHLWRQRKNGCRVNDLHTHKRLNKFTCHQESKQACCIQSACHFQSKVKREINVWVVNSTHLSASLSVQVQIIFNDRAVCLR